MFNDTHGTRGQTSPQIRQRWQRKLCHCKRRKDLGFPAFPDVASKICIVCSAYLSKEERLFFFWWSAGPAKPTAASSKLGFHPDLLLLTIYLAWTAATSTAGLSGSLPAEQALQMAHQTSTLFPTESSPAAAGPPRLDAKSGRPCSPPRCRNGLCSWRKTKQTPSLWLFCLLQIKTLRRREMKQLIGCPRKIQSYRQIRVSGKPNWKEFCSLSRIQAELKY